MYWKDLLEQWAVEKYPEQWKQLEQLARTEHEDGLRFDTIKSGIIIEIS